MLRKDEKIVYSGRPANGLVWRPSTWYTDGLVLPSTVQFGTGKSKRKQIKDTKIIIEKIVLDNRCN